MAEQSQDTTEEKYWREGLFTVIETIRNTPLPKNKHEQGTSRITQEEETDHQSKKTMSTNSNNTMDVPLINFKKY